MAKSIIGKWICSDDNVGYEVTKSPGKEGIAYCISFVDNNGDSETYIANFENYDFDLLVALLHNAKLDIEFDLKK